MSIASERDRNTLEAHANVQRHSDSVPGPVLASPPQVDLSPLTDANAAPPGAGQVLPPMAL